MSRALIRSAGVDAARLGRSHAVAPPSQFNISNAPERFARVGDLFAGVLKKPQRIEKAFGRLEALLKR